MTDTATEQIDEPCIACTLQGREFAERKEAISRELFEHLERVEELPDGYGFRFPAAEPWTTNVLDFIATEKQCCPFFTFEMAFEPNDGPLWLRLRGSAAIKEFIHAELGGIAPGIGSDKVAVMSTKVANESDRNKEIVRRLICDVLNGGQLDVIDELYSPTLAPKARRWIAPFRSSFPDVHMEVVDLIAEGGQVVGRFTCSGTHLGAWRGHPATGRRFEAVDEVSIFRIDGGKIVHVWGLEDTRAPTTARTALT